MIKKVQLEKGKKGYWTLKYGERYLHSSIDPVREAKRLVPENTGSGVYIVLGLGLGYHIRELLSRLEGRKAHVLVFEESLEIQRAYEDLGLVKDDRVQIFSLKNFSGFMDYFFKEIRFHEITNPCFIELKSETNIFSQEYFRVREKIDEFFNYYFQSLFTEAELGTLWYRNMVYNSRKVFNPSCSLYLEGDGVLVAAGPSLSLGFDFLRKIYKKVPIFAVDTALLPLSKAGIVPDVVVATDSQIHNYRDFFHVSGFEKMILAADISVYYKIPELFEKYLFFQTENLGEQYFDYFNAFENVSIPKFTGGGSVSSSALSLMFYLGAKRVTLVGQDLCYPNLTHSVGSVHYERGLFTSARKQTIWNFFNRIVRSRGKQDLFMQNLSRWLEDFIRITGLKVSQLNPVHPIAGAEEPSVKEMSGKLLVFEKTGNREHDKTGELWEVFFKALLELREAENVKDFFRMREKHPLLKPLFEKIFLKQDLYLHRRKGEPHLFLGGCFRIIDRLIRAIYHLKREGEAGMSLF